MEENALEDQGWGGGRLSHFLTFSRDRLAFQHYKIFLGLRKDSQLMGKQYTHVVIYFSYLTYNGDPRTFLYVVYHIPIG